MLEKHVSTFEIAMIVELNRTFLSCTRSCWYFLYPVIKTVEIFIFLCI